MKLSFILTTVLAASLMILGQNHEDKFKKSTKRVTRQTNADQMIQNILQWLHEVYTQQSRRSRFAEYDDLFNFTSDKFDDAFRQGTFREYLPPTNTQKPRPFEPVSPSRGNGIDDNGNFVENGYPPAGSITPRPPFSIFTNPSMRETFPYSTTAHPESTYTRTSDTIPTGYPTPPEGSLLTTGPTISTSIYPISTYQNQISNQPEQSTARIPEFSSYSGEISSEITTEYFTEKPSTFPTQSLPGVITYYPKEKFDVSTSSSIKPEFSTQPPSSSFTGYSNLKPEYSFQLPSDSTTPPSLSDTTIEHFSPITEFHTYTPPTDGPKTHISETLPSKTEIFTSATSPEDKLFGETTTQSPEIHTIPTEKSEKPSDDETKESTTNEDKRHPPHVHAIEVKCAKEMMTIDIEFSREFNGVIYSKGYYNMPECRYVKENSGQTKYSFTVNLNQCGTEFINAFDTQGQSYLENILVLQNEAGIQEIWDTVRAVRCLWEGSLKESLSVALSVGMLTQELVTFSGDTAMAKLDIILGRGPFGQPANGLVKIGEPMTLVVSVTGDSGFDVQVKDCRATDSTGDNIVPLTDENGCVLKPKLFGAFQKTRNTGDTGASIMAYALFNAFKFPDVMDLMIECNIELCKTDCGMCTNLDQKIEPSRRKRDLYNLNKTLHDGITMGKHLRVILEEDLVDKTIIELEKQDKICMTSQNFIILASALISLLTTSCLYSTYKWLKTQHVKK